MTRHAPTALLGSLLLLACGGSGSEDPRADLPNVLVITIDTLRADHLGCYDYFRDTSPALDAVATESLVFERCLTPVAQTLPTHTSLFTGLYPHEHGILANRDQGRIYVRAPKVRTAAEAMAFAGYETAAFVAAEPVKREGGLDTGFEHWWEPDERKVRSKVVVDQVLEWLDREHDRPWFLWVHVFDPHMTYDPPPPFDTMFRSDEAQAAHLAEIQVMERSRRYVTAEAHNLYDGEIRYTDSELRRLFDHLRGTARWEDLALVITSDHGEGMMQHRISGHGHIWLEHLRVPFLLKAPGLAPGRDETLLSTQDILPTAIGRIPDLAERLAPWLEECTGIDVLAGDQAPRPVIGQFPGSRKPMAYSIAEGRWRLVAEHGQPRLFDLEADPHELTDVAAQHPKIAVDLLERMMATIDEQRARGEALGAGGQKELSEERRTGLEDLGYGGDGDGSDE